MKKQDHAESAKARNPQWWQLYVGLPLICSLFLVEMRLHLTETEHVVLQLAILALIYVFVQAWMRWNRRALMGLDEEQGEWQFKIYEITPADLGKARETGKRIERRPLLQLPQSELKGVLSTTFEMDELEDEPAFPAQSPILYSDELFTKTQPIERQASTKEH